MGSMEDLFNKYHRILCDLLFLFLFLGLSIHPFFVKEVSYLFVYVKYIARLGLIVFFFKLIISVFLNIRTNKIALVLFAVLLFLILLSVFSIQIYNIEEYSSPLVVFIFCFIFLIFYTLIFDNRRLLVSPLLIKRRSRYLKHILNLFTVVLLFSLCLEVVVKFLPSNRLLYSTLRDEGVIAFAFRLCGFMLDANRWALVLLLLISICSTIFEKYFFKLTFLFYILSLYLVFTLSKTAFFIVLIIMMIDIWKFLLQIKFKKVIFFIFSVLVVVFLLSKTGYQFENSGLESRIKFTIESILNPQQSFSVNERKGTYNAAISSIVKHPVIGVGYLNFSAQGYHGDLTIHNTFLALLCYFGVFLGPIIYVLLFILPFILLAVKYGVNRRLVKLFIISFVFMNLLSVAHDMVLVLLFYITLIIFDITFRIKCKKLDEENTIYIK